MYCCAICEETLTTYDWQSGKVAEMHHPDNPMEFGGIVHAECGLSKGWEVS